MPKGYLKYPADQGDLCLLIKKEVVNLLNKKQKHATNIFVFYIFNPFFKK